MGIYYQTTFLISVICTIVYFVKVRKRHDINFGYMFFLMTVSNLGTLLRAYSGSVETAVMANKIAYVGATFLQIAMTFLILSLCRINYTKFMSLVMVIIGFILYGVIITDDFTHWYYKSLSIVQKDGLTILVKEYGFMHTVFYITITFYLVMNIAILIYGMVKKKDASIKNITALIVLEAVNVFVYFGQKLFGDGVELISLCYSLSQLAFLFIMDRISLYNIDNTVSAALLESGELACFSFAKDKTYLGCNHVAAEWFPQLTELRVDRPVPKDTTDVMFLQLDKWINEIEINKCKQEFYYSRNHRKYKFEGGYLRVNGRVVGYQFTVSDNTQEQKYIDLLNRYNVELADEVNAKTAHIEDIHNRMVLGMADMVEGRDPSTGGHIKRTSKVVEIIVNHMIEDEACNLDNQFCRAVIKAAPMHDLGKIAVRDAILLKEGKFTPDEYEEMKAHAASGALIVKKLLQDLDDDYFAQIAENVAHYHHERMDGTGYPTGMKGEQIPLEARIMAVADVYDALVSKRCYKDRMSFEQAYGIIESGMGSQFDGRLDKFFNLSRAQLEAFYTEEFKND